MFVPIVWVTRIHWVGGANSSCFFFLWLVKKDPKTPPPELISLKSATFGKDVVFACKVRHRDWKFS